MFVVSGAGSGLGRELALALARRGDRLALCGRTEATLEETAALATAAGATDVTWATVDVADATVVRSFAAAVRDRFGSVDGLVNNAGTLGAIGPIVDVDLSEWSAGLHTNVVGTATMIAAFEPMLHVSPIASIVNLSGGGIGGAGMPERVSSYVASKAAIVALTETLSRELSPVRVNAVAPGAVDTAFNARVLEVGANLAGEALVESVRAQVAAPFPMDPFVDLVSWLLSTASTWLSGCLLSARWETPMSIEDSRSQVEGFDRFRLRRIDGVMFDAVMEEHS